MKRRRRRTGLLLMVVLVLVGGGILFGMPQTPLSTVSTRQEQDPKHEQRSPSQTEQKEEDHHDQPVVVGDDPELLVEQWLNLPPQPEQGQGQEELRQRRQRRLELVHIPKTGGSVLEMVAATQGNVAWSYCHHRNRFHPHSTPYYHEYWNFWQQRQRQQQQPIMNNTTRNPNLNSNENNNDRNNRNTILGCPNNQQSPLQTSYRIMTSIPHTCAVWHMPPCFFLSSKTSRTERTTTTNYYDDAALFAVVRNPYDRLWSEYKWQLQRNMIPDRHNNQNQNNQNNYKNTPTAAGFNAWVRTVLRPWILNQSSSVSAASSNLNHNNATRTTTTAAATTPSRRDSTLCQVPHDTNHRDVSFYFQFDCHLIPQYDYIFAGPSLLFHDYDSRQQRQSQRQPQQVVHHVLFWDRLADQFPRLLQHYGWDDARFTLPPPPPPTTTSSSSTTTTTTQMIQQMLSERNRQRIQYIYENDFVRFGFSM